MTDTPVYFHGVATRPELGGCYVLRAGLRAFITEQIYIHGLLFWKGLVLDPEPWVNVWYGNGFYSPVPGASNELDIMHETPY
jgi:hypothetical protein